MSMLLAVFPTSDILATVGPFKLSLAFLLVLDECALVDPAVRPGERAFSVHQVKFPLAVISSPVIPSIVTFSIDIVFMEFALVYRAVCPYEMADAFFLTIFVVAFKLRAIRPDFFS